MTVTLASPATLLDLAELSGARTRTQWTVAKAVFRMGETYAFRDGERLLAIAGLAPIEGGAELWFCPGHPNPHQVVAIILLARLTLRASPYRGIVTICRSEAGKRLARALGFSPAANSELGEIWGYAGPIGQRNREEAAAVADGYPGGKPASQPGADGARAGAD